MRKIYIFVKWLKETNRTKRWNRAKRTTESKTATSNASFWKFKEVMKGNSKELKNKINELDKIIETFEESTEPIGSGESKSEEKSEEGFLTSIAHRGDQRQNGDEAVTSANSTVTESAGIKPKERIADFASRFPPTQEHENKVAKSVGIESYTA